MEKELNQFISNLLTKYTINEDGDVYSFYKRGNLKTHLNHKGYLRVTLSINGKGKAFFLHRLVLMAFSPTTNMELLEVNHKDGNKLNNSLNNLEWVTTKENINHAIKNQLRADFKGSKNGYSVLTEEDVYWIIEQLKLKSISQQNMADIVGCSKSTISAIKHGRNWSHLTKGLIFD